MTSPIAASTAKKYEPMSQPPPPKVAPVCVAPEPLVSKAPVDTVGTAPKATPIGGEVTAATGPASSSSDGTTYNGSVGAKAVPYSKAPNPLGGKPGPSPKLPQIGAKKSGTSEGSDFLEPKNTVDFMKKAYAPLPKSEAQKHEDCVKAYEHDGELLGEVAGHLTGHALVGHGTKGLVGGAAGGFVGGKIGASIGKSVGEDSCPKPKPVEILPNVPKTEPPPAPDSATAAADAGVPIYTQKEAPKPTVKPQPKPVEKQPNASMMPPPASFTPADPSKAICK